MNLEGLDLSILGPACVAGLLVLSTHVPLGKQVLSRGIIFIDLAIAQIAGLGVILAQYLGIDSTVTACRSPPLPPHWPAPACCRGPTGAGRNTRSR